MAMLLMFALFLCSAVLYVSGKEILALFVMGIGLMAGISYLADQVDKIRKNQEN